MDIDWIHNAVDNAFEKMKEGTSSMRTPGDLPSEMLDHSIPPMDDWKGWKPIPSIITNEDLNRFEHKIGCKLPLSFREFLKYKHFVRLYIPNSAVNFFPHLPDHDLKQLDYHIFRLNEPELLIGQGYIYFADFNDYGLLCFDTNYERENNEWKVVWIDHEDIEVIHDYADNFKYLMEADEEHGNRFIDKLNELYA